MRFAKRFTMLGVALWVGAASLSGGCGDTAGDNTSNAGGSGSNSSQSSTTGTGGGEATCSPQNPACTVVESECLAMTDNSAKTKFGMRMAQLTITTPSVLATGSIAELVALGVRMDWPECYLNGNGTFSWLLEFDTATGKFRTGGAPL